VRERQPAAQRPVVVALLDGPLTLDARDQVEIVDEQVGLRELERRPAGGRGLGEAGREDAGDPDESEAVVEVEATQTAEKVSVRVAARQVQLLVLDVDAQPRPETQRVEGGLADPGFDRNRRRGGIGRTCFHADAGEHAEAEQPGPRLLQARLVKQRARRRLGADLPFDAGRGDPAVPLHDQPPHSVPGAVIHRERDVHGERRGRDLGLGVDLRTGEARLAKPGEELVLLRFEGGSHEDIAHRELQARHQPRALDRRQIVQPLDGQRADARRPPFFDADRHRDRPPRAPGHPGLGDAGAEVAGRLVEANDSFEIALERRLVEAGRGRQGNPRGRSGREMTLDFLRAEAVDALEAQRAEDRAFGCPRAGRAGDQAQREQGCPLSRHRDKVSRAACRTWVRRPRSAAARQKLLEVGFLPAERAVVVWVRALTGAKGIRVHELLAACP